MGELFNFHYGDGNNNPSNGGKYPVFGAGGIQGGYTKYNAENSVIIGHMGDAGCVSWGEGKHFATYNGTITKPKDEVFSAKFGYYLLLHMNLRKYSGGSGLPFLTYDMLTEMETKCTNSKIETQKIADYFTHLDRLITLHQRKPASLKQPPKVKQHQPSRERDGWCCFIVEKLLARAILSRRITRRADIESAPTVTG